ncbi:hypothetical protein JB92DRAFT_679588 [Gautieria morchelliformis]|nr:hypothetical protein JB92DRAFT_679588 [Gautieria morchelliformis]
MTTRSPTGGPKSLRDRIARFETIDIPSSRSPISPRLKTPGVNGKLTTVGRTSNPATVSSTPSKTPTINSSAHLPVDDLIVTGAEKAVVVERAAPGRFCRRVFKYTDDIIGIFLAGCITVSNRTRGLRARFCAHSMRTENVSLLSLPSLPAHHLSMVQFSWIRRPANPSLRRTSPALLQLSYTPPTVTRRTQYPLRLVFPS